MPLVGELTLTSSKLLSVRVQLFSVAVLMATRQLTGKI